MIAEKRTYLLSPPCDSNRGILKIDTNTDTVTELGDNPVPDRGNCMRS